jgi:hypothetical protein
MKPLQEILKHIVKQQYPVQQVTLYDHGTVVQVTVLESEPPKEPLGNSLLP